MEKHPREFDLCDWQHQERERHVNQRDYRIRGKRDEMALCADDINTGLNESDLASVVSDQLLTNADRTWIIRQARNRRGGRKSLHDYFRKNHELSVLQYTLNVKRNEIDRLENQLREEERRLIRSEKYITEDLALFDQFLDACNRTASEAAARADEQSLKKEELMNEIKRSQTTLLAYQNGRNHLTDLLKQSRRYQQFLFKFAPEDWRGDILKDLETKRIGYPWTESPQNIRGAPVRNLPLKEIDFQAIAEEDCSLYFTQPDQLLDIFTEMEEKSLPLVEKSQQMSELLDNVHSRKSATEAEQDHHAEELQFKINHLEELIKQDTAPETVCRALLEQYQTAKDDPFMDQLKRAVEALYKRHLISDDIGIATIHMLQAIESKIQSLLSTLEQMDPADIREAEKSRVMMVRTMERQEKLLQEKSTNQAKQQKALLRSIAPPYIKIGRTIMERSRPLLPKRHHKKHSVISKQEQLMRLLGN